MADILILGGTRNLGHFTALSLLDAGHGVTVLNRGKTPDELPAQVERLRADRSNTDSMRRALAGRSFDVVIDTTTYTGHDARQAVEIFSRNTDRYFFIGTGQVYLVRDGIRRPFREEDYAGPLIAEPEPGTLDHAGWKYGIEKREAESVFDAARSASGFPVMTMRLPMVASERDHHGRIQAYAARIRDRCPILVPEERGLPIRHVYVKDVAALLTKLAMTAEGIGLAVNISWGESMELDDFIAVLGNEMHVEPIVVRKPRSELEAAGLLPGCSPFSGRWMSELDNKRSIEEHGAAYTAPREYLAAIAADYETRWRANQLVPAGLEQRRREVVMAYP